MGKAVILYNKLSENPLQDELDVLDQVAVVESALNELGHDVFREEFDLDMNRVKNALQEINPKFVFNLVETVDGKGNLIFLAPALLESLKIPFSGSGLHSMYLTSNKILAKEAFRNHNIPTGEWFMADQCDKLNKSKRYIVKPLWEDGSVGISEQGVFYGNDPEIKNYFKNRNPKDYFIEEYIHGREFNISVLGGKSGPKVLPPAEIKFIDFPEGKPHILGYESKWDEDSFEYKNTVRTFDFPESDKILLDKLNKICYDCWESFGLKGYVRVDIRVDEKNNPFVLEINANPCISPDAGFYAACSKAGIKFTKVISEIIYDALN